MLATNREDLGLIPQIALGFLREQSCDCPLTSTFDLPSTT